MLQPFSNSSAFPRSVLHIGTHALTHSYTLSLPRFFLRPLVLSWSWHQIASLQQSTPLGGICISFACHYRFNRANCAPSGVKMTWGEEERWRLLRRVSLLVTVCASKQLLLHSLGFAASYEDLKLTLHWRIKHWCQCGNITIYTWLPLRKHIFILWSV